MSTKSGSIDYWRKFFRSANSWNMFEVIENAIMVAASDYPKEFKLKMDRIAKTLCSCGLGCDHVELALPKDEGGLNGSGGDFEGHRKAKALTEEIEEETQIVEEVLRIKETLANSQDQNSKRMEEISFEKIECTKRKLHEGYQKAENAKKQRKIQVIELHDILKQGLGQRNIYLKPANHN